MKKKLWIPSVLISVFIFGICTVSYLHLDRHDDGKNFDRLCQEIFYNELDGDTLNLHYTLAYPEDYGIEDYAVTFGSVMDASEDDSMILAENYLTRLKEISPESLDTQQQLTYDILLDTLEDEIDGHDLWMYGEILSPSSGIQGQLPVLLAEYTFRNERDVKDYLTLLSQIQDYFAEICRFQDKRAAEGFVMPDFSVDKLMEQCQEVIANQKDYFLLSTFDDRIEGCDFLSQSQKAEYSRLNQEALAEHFFPAYQDLLDYLPSLKGKNTNPQGLCYYPEGKEYYQSLVSYYTGTDYTIKDLKTLLERQWEKDLNTLRKATDNLSAADEKKKPVFSDPVAILKDLKQKIETDFPALPETNCTVKYVDPSMEKYLSPAFYLTPPIDDSSENTIYINRGSAYEGVDLYTVLAHEGYPGHLYHSVYQNSLKLNPLRNLFYCGGYVEGWALYVEMSSFDWAGLSPDLAQMERANRSLLLNLYSMLDIYIHYEGYSLEEVKNMLASYGSFPEAELEEMYQYIVEEPGNYLKYYIGYLEILKLKDRAEKALGDRYSLKAFHEFILTIGPAPFPLIKERQDMWFKHILSSF